MFTEVLCKNRSLVHDLMDFPPSEYSSVTDTLIVKQNPTGTPEFPSLSRPMNHSFPG